MYLARRFGLLGLAGALWLGVEAPTQAQVRIIPSIQQRNPGTPNWLVAPGLTQAQYLSQVRAYARTAAQIPPWLYGYNPYPSPIISTGPVIPPTPYTPGPLYNTPVSPWAMGGMSNPYAPVGAGAGYGTGASNPYTPVDPYGAGSNSYYPPYGDYYDPAGGVLRGAADVVRAYGSQITSMEQARIMREQANQAKLETIKQKFDLDMYIKTHTPTFTELQAKRAASTLRRIQENATPGEITSGRSHNVLLEDLGKHLRGRKLTADVPMIPEDVLMSLNVAGPSSAGTLGILRDGKIPAWPTALQEIFTPAQRKAIDDQLLALYKSAETGKVDPNQAKEVKKTLDKARDDLGRRFDDVGITEYLDGKRFLNELDMARLSLQNGDGKAQAEYLAWAKGGAKSVQDLAAFLIEKGWKIAPSVAADEAAYRAVHSALAALDVQANVQFASAAPDYKE